ncbi:MAG: hypothetical protein PHH14_05420 [Candidatus Margulisbacteria bacterium]|nr:hypothetical protein [Candidatus Margulisiibacteriota bacterium]
MSVNAVIGNAGSQEMAVAATQGLINQMEEAVQKMDGKNEKRAAEKLQIKTLLESKEGMNVGTEVLSNLVAKLAESGINVQLGKSAETAKNKQDDYELMFENKEDIQDSTSVSDAFKKIAGARKTGQQKGGGGDEGMGDADPRKLAGKIEEFNQAVAQYLIGGGDEFKQKVLKLRQELENLGVSHKQVLQTELSVKNQIRGQIASLIKEGVLKQLFAPKKTVESVMTEVGTNKAINLAYHNDRIGGWDFGGYNEHLQGTTDKAMAEAKGEIKDFIGQELERYIMARHAGTEKNDKLLKELVKLAERVGFDLNNFVKDVTSKKIDWGMIEVPEAALAQAGSAGAGSGGEFSSGSQGKTGYEYTLTDEQSLLTNQLRAVFMQRALFGDIRTTIATSFKMMQLKNGLIKMGITFDVLKEIESEGTTLAKQKLKEMLEEALLERATLFDLSGPAFKLIETRIKGIMKNLDRLGAPVGKSEFDTVQGQADREMFEVARTEMEKTLAHYRGSRAPHLAKKLKLLVKQIKRLQAEAGIYPDYQPEEELAGIKAAA